MNPKPQNVLKLLQNIEVILEPSQYGYRSRISTNPNTIFDTQHIEALFELPFSFNNLLPYYKMLQHIIENPRYKKEVDLLILQQILMEVLDKMYELYKHQDTIKGNYFYDDGGVIMGSLRNLKNEINNLTEVKR